MTFLSPIFFWFLLALIPLALVYLMKTRPRKRMTNTIFLWEQVLQEDVTKIWLKKIRNLLSLLLLLAVFLFSVFSLTEPKLSKNSTQDVLLILDRSVSMKAGEGARFKKAVDEIKSVLRAVEGGNRVALATVDKELTYHSHLSQTTRGIKKQLKEMSPTPYPLKTTLLKDLSILPEEQEGLKILFFTDGNADLSGLPALIRPVIVGKEEGNLGLIAGDLDLLPDRTAKLFFTLSSSFKEKKEVELELRNVETGRVGKFLTLSLEPLEKKSEVIQIENAELGAWELTILSEDALSEDNTLFLGLNAQPPISVSLSTENPYFYTSFIQAFQYAENLLQLVEEKDADLLLAEKALPPSGLKSLLINPEGESPYYGKTGELLPLIIPEVLIPEHPVLKHLNVENLPFLGAKEVEAPEGAVVILREASGTPLLYTCEHEGREVVVVNFDPGLGEFYLSPSYPVLLHNVARYLANREKDLPSLVQVGRGVTLPFPPSSVTASHFNGEEETALSPLTSLTPTLEELGAYSFSHGGSSLTTGAGVLSATESGAPSSLSETLEKPSFSRGWSLAWYLLLLAAVILLVEDALYHRRRVG